MPRSPVASPMLDSYLRDVGYLTSDLLTGKSLPLLAAIALLPLDPSLLGAMVLLGVLGGGAVTLASLWSPPPPGLVTWGVRFLNLFFSAFLSVSFALHVSARAGGRGAWLVPGFCVVMQAVPERPTTLVVLGALNLALFYLSVFETAERMMPDRSPGPTRQLLAAEWMPVLPDRSPGPTRQLLAAEAQAERAPPQLADEAGAVLSSLGSSLVVLVLALYSGICHGPVGSQRYTSPDFAGSRVYAVAVSLSAGLTRAYTYLATAYFRDHALHVLLDGSDSPAEPWTAWLYLVALAYSAAWACTQFTAQVLTVFQGDQTDMRARATVLLFALAYLHQWQGTAAFWATFGMTLITLGAMGLSTAYHAVFNVNKC